MSGALCLMLLIVFGLYGPMSGLTHQLTASEAAAYNALVRPAWALALGTVVFLCANGYAREFAIWVLLARVDKLSNTDKLNSSRLSLSNCLPITTPM